MKILGKDLLTKIKEAQLSGEVSHELFSPPSRTRLSHEEIMAKKPRLAAVNTMLYWKNDEWYFPLIVRTENKNDSHSGQISLPGGKYEKKDADYSETAKRETHEEVGIETSYIRIIRELTPIYIEPSNFYVHPFISYTKKNPQFNIQTKEVKELIEFPLTSLFQLTDRPKMMKLKASLGEEVPVIHFNHYIVWGATSMILSELSYLLKNL